MVSRKMAANSCMKEGLPWLAEFPRLAETREKLSAWINFFNRRYPHSGLGSNSPQQYRRPYRKQHLAKAD